VKEDCPCHNDPESDQWEEEHPIPLHTDDQAECKQSLEDSDYAGKPVWNIDFAST